MNATAVACLLCLCASTILLTGCEAIQQASREETAARIDESIAAYRTAATKVRLGDSKEQVLELLQPTQFPLQSNEIKPPEAFPTQTAAGDPSLVEIHFFRSSRHPDEAGTDRQGLPLPDNFTPYIFTDGVLTGIGWTDVLSLRMRKPDHPPRPQADLCQQMGPLAGCF
ncbi:MAG: hypothetical protein FJ249_08395 [Nitrospira sp.]|nr:hypothetical protein [Nitrospira sp.]